MRVHAGGDGEYLIVGGEDHKTGQADDIFIATGDSGNGMTHGTIAGILLTDLIAGRDNPWANVYRPSRKTLFAAGTFAKENLNVALQYADHLKGGDVSSVDDLPCGSGAVLQDGLHKLAVTVRVTAPGSTLKTATSCSDRRLPGWLQSRRRAA